jgi:hypothetical protein
LIYAIEEDSNENDDLMMNECQTVEDAVADLGGYEYYEPGLHLYGILCDAFFSGNSIHFEKDSSNNNIGGCR